MSQTQIVGIGQIAVRVLDLDRAIATYRDRLGLRFLFRAPPALAFFQCGGVRLMLSPPEAGEFDHASSILYFTVDDIQSTHDQLTGRGVRFRSAPHVVADLGDRVLWLSDFEDGEGNVHALMAEVPKEGRARFAQSTPILRVANFDASVSYYRDVLGFTLEWRDRGFGCVRRGDATLMLSQGGQGAAGTWVFVGVSDADAVHAELRDRGARIRHPPTNYPWGARETHVFDLDGHVLRLASDATPDEPLGEWLDEEGVSWRPQPDGSWRRSG